MSEPPVPNVIEGVASTTDVQITAATFDALFRRYAPYVGAIALRILGRSEDVDDVVQDVFLDAYRGIRGLRDPDAVKGWLSRVTVRTSIRKLKKRRLRAFFRLDDTPEYEQVADAAASPETKALIGRVYRTLDALPAEERVAWTLRHLGGEELEDIATLTGASLATIKRRIARANAVLKGDDDGRA